MCSVKIALRWIFTCKINENQAILTFTNPRFGTQLCAGHNAKSKSYLANEMVLYPWLDKKQKLSQYQMVS